MYFKKIKIENVGPIDHIALDFPLKEERPLPVVIVGENGSGKTILLSHLVNSLIVGKQEVFEDTEVEKGKVYKYRSPDYIMSGRDYSFSSVEFDFGANVIEWQLSYQKQQFAEHLRYVPNHKEWKQIPDGNSSFFDATFRKNKSATGNFFKNHCCLYFPVNRFEEPAWLNLENLRHGVRYTELKRISAYSNRNIVCTSPLKNNKNWLLDIIFDRQAYEVVLMQSLKLSPVHQPQLQVGYQGQSTTIYDAIIRVLLVILRNDDIRFGMGTRKNRQISVIKNEQPWIPDLFQLSTGETQLLNLFLSVVRDYDLSSGALKELSDIKGIVIIDEIDAHLHTVHQTEVLPELIALFPGVQFVITTHSPLFLMGMEKKFGTEGFLIYKMPNGDRVAASDFSEFMAAYEAFKETTRHREEIRRELEQHDKPVVFVEGDYDIRYLKKAAEFLGKGDLLKKIHMKDGGGYGNLEKIWKSYDNPLSSALPRKVMLIYDCDIVKKEASRDLVYKRVIPSVDKNPIAKGIENLFPPSTIEKLEDANPSFIDFEEPVKRRVRGVTEINLAVKSVNKDEKGNICTWLCMNGAAEDFVNFKLIFDLIEEVINS